MADGICTDLFETHFYIAGCTAAALLETAYSHNACFSVHEDATGKALWRIRINGVVNSFPIKYSVEGTICGRCDWGVDHHVLSV